MLPVFIAYLNIYEQFRWLFKRMNGCDEPILK